MHFNLQIRATPTNQPQQIYLRSFDKIILMESGTLLHIALLRKTSNANKRPKPVASLPNKPLLTSAQSPQPNFTLTGWCTEQDHPINYQKCQQNRDLRQSYELKHKNLLSQRVNAKTSQCSHRSRLRSQSFRKYKEYKSTQESQGPDVANQRLKQLNSQSCIKGIKLHKLGNAHGIDQECGSQKQNLSSPQLQGMDLKKNEISRWQNENTKLTSLPYSMNFNSIRGRRFFKL